ncbi:hypothetical protein ERJ75_000601900 [Trypanosoma vivax]|nr:hypothetical protein ERJ75_000601900 [Trypanosoma vivax]
MQTPIPAVVSDNRGASHPPAKLPAPRKVGSLASKFPFELDVFLLVCEVPELVCCRRFCVRLVAWEKHVRASVGALTTNRPLCVGMVARVEALGRDCFQHCILDALQAMHLAHTMFLTSLVTHPRRAASWLLHCVASRTSGQLVASWLGGSVALLSWSTYFSPCLSLVNSKASNTRHCQLSLHARSPVRCLG